MKKRSRIFAIARKEFFHIIHDPRSLIIIFLLPTLQLIMFGYALNLEIQNVNLAIIDYDRSPLSEDLIQKFSASEYFTVHPYQELPSEINQLFLRREMQAVLIIPADFSRKINMGNKADVQLILDAVDPNAAINIRNYCNQIILDFNQNYLRAFQIPIRLESNIWFNPDMKSTYFFVPGLLALLLVMISALMTSITITREKETGTLEQILVSPVSAREIIIGKVIPYIFLAFLVGSLIIGIGVFLFGVPFRGSLLLLVLLTILYIVTALSLGLMISSIVPTQQVAMMAALVATLLPTLILSGFIFPLKSMPYILQMISYIIPAKYYLTIVRGIMLKGNSLFQLYIPVFFLILMSFVLLNVAVKRFRLNLEK